jgi:hypothetical protein
MSDGEYQSAKAELPASRGPACFRKRSAIAWVVLLLVLALTWFCRFRRSEIPNAYHDLSLLGGPAGLSIFIIVVGLSAYLRQVAGTADEKRQELRTKGDTLYPKLEPGIKNGRTACTERKIEALEDTFGNLQIAAGFLILLSLTVAIRLFVESLTKPAASDIPSVEFYFRVWDALILEWLVLATFALGIMHWRARNRDEKIRVIADKWRLEELEREHSSGSK